MVESDAPLVGHNKKGEPIWLELKGRYTAEPFFPPIASIIGPQEAAIMSAVGRSDVKLAEWRGERVLTELKLNGSRVVIEPGPLMYAVINGNSRMVQRLLEAGADPDLAITSSSSEKN
ncbi:MAG: ankyrin repeat domain-containing protein [Verrucomicrobia bacterium]|nr:ankyrin repeat domain-containing protein [Verrucomicrobiota bacterium]